MDTKPHGESEQWSQSDLTMAATELFASELFSVADNDSQYHHRLGEVKKSLVNGQCNCQIDEVALSILAWSGVLK
jgi:hypothetical protein